MAGSLLTAGTPCLETVTGSQTTEKEQTWALTGLANDDVAG